MGSPQFRFCLPISDSGTGERTGDTASRLVIVTLGTDSRLRHPRSVPPVRPVGEGSWTASHGPLQGLPDAASMPRTDRSPAASMPALENDNAGTIPGTERPPQASGPEARLRLLDHPHANRRSPGRYAKWLGGSTETQRRRPTTLAAWGS